MQKRKRFTKEFKLEALQPYKQIRPFSIFSQIKIIPKNFAAVLIYTTFSTYS